MINLKRLYKNMNWNIAAGIALLIFAFVVMITSANGADSTENPAPETVTENKAMQNFPSETILGEAIHAAASEETTTENTTTEIETEKPTAASSKKKAKKLIDFDAEHPFLIRVNRAENFTVIYGMDKNGVYSVPYKAFICSTALFEENTPLGMFEISDKYRWRLMVDDSYAQYAIRIHGQIMLHSIPYMEEDNSTLEYEEYNKLGTPASLGCVRFRVAAIKWIYENCNEGTLVEIYSEPGEVPPLKIAKIKKLKGKSKKSGWDPTDPAEGNPWKKKKGKSNG